ncbi:hypothetical protein [Synechococcus sp. M16CYN]|uniref:hypothetical protein n=1 Tax=Synechococcus sp. M16CYN TaxID=3103139 RepID=UPI00324D6E28
MVKGAIRIAIASALSLGTAARAALAWMLIRSMWIINPDFEISLVIEEFASIGSCEAVATQTSTR